MQAHASLRGRSYLGLLCAIVVVFILLGTLFPAVGTHHQATVNGIKREDRMCLRRIGEACLIYSADRNDQLPTALNVWRFAQLLAENDREVLNSTFWQSRIDPASAPINNKPIPVLAKGKEGEPSQLNPDFLRIKPSVAVALGTLKASMPSSTPIAWTRGLQPDGTWAKHSPYGTDGGNIVFIGGNTEFYHKLSDDGGRLMRFDGKGKTANILEALPPGSRIGEYAPTPSEQIAWSNAPRQVPVAKIPWFRRWDPSPYQSLVISGWSLFFLLAIFRLENRKGTAASDFTWPLVIAVVLLFLLK
jgi:hypothetical protein